MKKVKILDKTFELYIEESEILRRITILGNELNEEFSDKSPLLISVLNGAFMFTSDLMKTLNFPCEVSFVKLASYDGISSTGAVKTILGLELNIQNRDVILIEDIIDTGNTLAAFIPILKEKNPKSIKLISLISKPKALKHPIHIDRTCFEIPNDFIVGYGLDYDGYGRNLRDIYVITN